MTISTNIKTPLNSALQYCLPEIYIQEELISSGFFLGGKKHTKSALHFGKG